jgi:general secretion pathway protein G
MKGRPAVFLNPRLIQRGTGFTLIELLVVMAIVSLLVAIVAPKYFDSVDRAKEVALRTEAIDKERADTNHLPASLQRLVELRYIRSVPIDPITDSADTWAVVPHPDGETPGVFDIRSGASGTARDGSPFSSW